jgi:YHS domain-containing protein
MRLLTALTLVLAPSVAPPALQEPVRRADYAHLNVDEQGLALSGYDAVAYFPEGGGKATKGKPEIALQQGGVTWRFASEANRELFKAAPARFEPAYGGWCAWAMVEGDKVEVDPTSFLIEEGRLLVFYDALFADTRKQWLKKGGASLRPKADAAWKKIVEPPRPPPGGGQTAHIPVER